MEQLMHRRCRIEHFYASPPSTAMKINQKQMERMMKQMGMKTEHIPAEEVIIRTPDKEIVISRPDVAKVNMMGQETFQISGTVSEREAAKFSADDVRMVMEQTGATAEQARQALADTGDIAEAILRLRRDG